jgi:hypothetical protein
MRGDLQVRDDEDCYGSDSDLGERRAGVRFHPESGRHLARPIRLIDARSGPASQYQKAKAQSRSGLRGIK